MFVVIERRPENPNDEQTDHVSDFHRNLNCCINAVLAPMHRFGKGGRGSSP